MSRLTREQIDGLRAQFPAFARRVNGHPAAYFDGPGGTQTPQRVIDAVSHCMAHTNANHEGRFATSRESDAMLHEAHQAMADLLGADDSDCVTFGANMTTLTFHVARALGRQSVGAEPTLDRRREAVEDPNFGCNFPGEGTDGEQPAVAAPPRSAGASGAQSMRDRC